MNDKTQNIDIKKDKTLKGVQVDGKDKRFQVIIKPSAANGSYKKDEEKEINAESIKEGDSTEEKGKKVKVKYNSGHLKKSLKLTQVDGKNVKNNKNVWSKLTG